MASGSGGGIDRDDGNQEPGRGDGQRDDANAASGSGAPSSGAAGGASGDSPPPPPFAPPVAEQARGGSFDAPESSSAGEARAGFPRAKKTLLSKFFSFSKNVIICRTGIIQNCTGSPEGPHVNQQAISYEEAVTHYHSQCRTILVNEGVYPDNALDLRDRYSQFRPVAEDGECFYRSFIFSYLEQVLDRQEADEESRLLAAIEEVAETEEHARLGWTSQFSMSHEAFKKLIKKVERWKTKGRLKSVAATESYRKQKLVKFFSTYDKTADIFAFLRLVAAVWLLSHRADYAGDIPGLGENDSLKDWCLQHVTPRSVVAGRVQMWALAAALNVTLVLARLSVVDPEDVYVGVSPVRVHVLLSVNHYDILYPV